MGFYKNKKVLVTGGTGLIGRPLVDLLIKEEAQVRVVSLDDASRANPNAKFKRLDLTDYHNCMEACSGMKYVFNLIGVKGSPRIAKEKPATFFVNTVLFNTNMMEAARKSGVERYLYTSSVGVYGTAEILKEDDVWRTFPSEHDKFPGWAKRIGELQAQAYLAEHKWDKISVVRPANVYGPYDNFDPASSMVVPSLIRRVVDGEDPLTVWGDGTQVRDFIFAGDVAKAMKYILKEGYNQPVNIGSGKGYSIKYLIETILKIASKNPEIYWDRSKPTGDKIRVMDISRLESLGWHPETSLKEGIKETIKWYQRNKSTTDSRYDVFGKR